MMKNEKLKQLEMALGNHKPVIVDLGDEQRFLLKWDESMQNYVGISLQTGLEIGVWTLEMLLQIAYGKIDNCSLEVIYE